MTREEAKSCISTIEMLQRLAYNIHGVMDVIDADNCDKIIKALEQEPKAGHWSHDGSHWKNRFICSECGYKLFDEPTNYCPNCGAKMESEDKE